MLRSLTGLCVLLSMWSLSAARVHACGGSPTPPPSYFSIESVSPADETTDFPRNGAIRAEFRAWDSISGDGTEPSIRVTRVDNGESVAGKIEDGFAARPGVIWVPSKPFAAKTQYRIEITSTEHPDPDLGATTETSTTFTTSDAVTPDVQLDGDLHVELRIGSVPSVDYNSCNDCGQCTVNGELPALFADVDLPNVSGGFDAYGYRGVLVLSNDAPRTFKGPGEGRIVGEELVNIIQYVMLPASGMLRLSPMVPLEDRSYSPCFAFNVWDPNGQTKSTSVCLPAQEVDRFAPELAGSTPTQGNDAGAGKHDEPRSIMDVDAAMAAAPDAGTISPAMPNLSGRDGGTKPAASDERAMGCAVSAGGMQPAGLASMLSVLGALLALVLRRRQLC